MINFEAAEENLLALLEPLRQNGILCRALPDEPNAVGLPDGYATVITVALSTIKPSDRVSMDFQVQTRWYMVVCDLRSQRLRGATGLYGLPKQLEKALQGQAVPGLGRLQFEDFTFEDRGEQFWGGSVKFKVLAQDVL